MSNIGAQRYSKPDLPCIIDTGWSICYETRLKDKPFIRSWAVYQGVHDGTVTLDPSNELGAHRFGFWQEVNNDALGRGGGRVRLMSTLLCTADYHPLHYELQVVDTRLAIDFGKMTFCASLPDGSKSEGSWECADFLLAGNMLPQLALKVRLLKAMGVSAYDGAFFSPDALQVVPYALTADEGNLCSSFDEVIHLDDEGWITEVVLPDKEVTVRRVKWALPSWRMGSEVLSAKLQARAYQPPSDSSVHLIDIDIPGPVVDLGATLALPPDGIRARAAALFIGGSGQHDRHGFSSNGLDLGYHELLDRIAGAGIISLRFDKRGAGDTKLGPDFLEFGFDDLVRDTRAAFDCLRGLPEAHGLPVFLIGHSQGGLVALDLSGGDASIAGVVLLATAGRAIDSVLEDQVTTQAKEIELSQESLTRRIDDLKTYFHCVRYVPEWTPETVPPRSMRCATCANGTANCWREIRSK